MGISIIIIFFFFFVHKNENFALVFIMRRAIEVHQTSITNKLTKENLMNHNLHWNND